MKPKETQSQEDILEQMKAAWQEQCRRADQMPWLSDETLEQLYAKYSKEHGEVPPPTGLHHPTWAQMLTALIGLGAMVYSVVLCHRMWDDIYMRLLLCGVAAASLFIIVQSLFPARTPYRRDVASASAALLAELGHGEIRAAERSGVVVVRISNCHSGILVIGRREIRDLGVADAGGAVAAIRHDRVVVGLS